MKKYFLTLIFALIFANIALAQKLEYGLDFVGLFDNREFPSGYSESETITGSGFDFDIGTTIDSIHHIRIGINYFYEFGSKILDVTPNPILYYSVTKGPWDFIIGAFTRNKAIQMPLAFISEKYADFNPTVDGIQLSYGKKNFKGSLFMDWVSRLDSVRREQFMTCFNGSFTPGNFIAEAYWYLFHDRPNLERLPGDHIMDYTGANFMLGYNFSKLLNVDLLTLKGGVLTSLYRNRGNGLDFEVANSAYFDLSAEYKGYGVHSVLNFGQPHHFSHGDNFYNNTSSYVRTDVYFTPIRLKNIMGKFMWSFHVANSKLDHQQVFILVYTFNPV